MTSKHWNWILTKLFCAQLYFRFAEHFSSCDLAFSPFYVSNRLHLFDFLGRRMEKRRVQKFQSAIRFAIKTRLRSHNFLFFHSIWSMNEKQAKIDLLARSAFFCEHKLVDIQKLSATSERISNIQNFTVF
jgi:hypothetical protein